MARRAQPIARVRLARSLPRMLAAPFVALLLASALAAAGILLVGGVPGLAMAAAAGVVALGALLGAAVLLSVRVDVEDSLVRVRSLLGRRIYLLTPGELTRVHLRGERASRLQARFGMGWALGRAVLRDEEEIHVVRLALVASVILIPTARGRLAIATANEPHLIEALTRAAHARATTDELAEAAPAADAFGHDEGQRLQTGIERSESEDQEEREQAAAAAIPATVVAPPLPPLAEPVLATAGPRRIFRRPSWARRRPSLPAMSVPAVPMPSMPSVSMRALPDRVRALPIRRPRPSWLIPLVPLVAAGAAWGVGVYLDRIPPSGSDTARLTVLALILAGPATTIGAVMARTWWPRLVGVVVMGGLAGAIFIGRALLGS